MPSLCGSAEATREWFRAFTAHSFLACRPLRPRGVRHRYPDIRCRHWPSPIDQRLGTPDTPAIRFTRAVDLVASLVRFRYSLPGCSPPCTDQPSGTFTSRLSTERSPSPLLDIPTTARLNLLYGAFFVKNFQQSGLTFFLLVSFFVRSESAVSSVSDRKPSRAGAVKAGRLFGDHPRGLGVEQSPEHGCTVERRRAGSAR